MKSYKQILEAKSDYVVYHKTYTSAVQEIERFAKANGYTLDDETDKEDIGSQMFDLVGSGPPKPKDGKTNKFSFKIYKNNKLAKKGLHAQIYGMGKVHGSTSYELNMYIS